MADNVAVSPALSGGATIAADDISSVHYQRTKFSIGADGSAVDAIGVSAALDSTGSGIQAVGVVGQFDDTSPAAVTENQFAPIRISSRRAVLVEGVASGTAITTISSVVGGGTEATATRVTIASDSTGVLSVDDNGGSLTIDGTVTASNTAGTAANGAAPSGNPVAVAAEARTTLPTAVDDGDVVRPQADKAGRLVTSSGAPRGLTIKNTITLTGTTETTLLAAAASTFHDLTTLVISNTSATLVRVDIRDTTGGTVMMSVAAAADGGGAVINFPVPMEQAAVNTNWTAQLSGSVTDVRIFALAVKRN